MAQDKALTDLHAWLDQRMAALDVEMERREGDLISIANLFGQREALQSVQVRLTLLQAPNGPAELARLDTRWETRHAKRR